MISTVQVESCFYHEENALVGRAKLRSYVHMLIMIIACDDVAIF